MKAPLQQVWIDPGRRVGNCHTYVNRDGTLTVRQYLTEMGPDETPSVAGLQCLPTWIRPIP
jgi:hypothetical protein